MKIHLPAISYHLGLGYQCFDSYPYGMKVMVILSIKYHLKFIGLSLNGLTVTYHQNVTGDRLK